MAKKGFLSGIMAGSNQTQADSKLSIDYPQAGEKVQPGHYSIRISGGDQDCHVAIDGSGWQSCRSDAGYQWYDWAVEPGFHRISVRTRVNGKWVKAERTCDVK